MPSHLSTLYELFNRLLSSSCLYRMLAKQGTAPRILCYVFSGRLDVIHKPVGSRAGSSGQGGEARTARSAAAWDATCGNSQAQVKLQLASSGSKWACTVTDACTVLHIFDHIYCNQSFIYAWLASRCM